MGLSIRAAAGGEFAVDDATLGQLRSSLSGTVLLPGTPRYDVARTVWNAMIDRSPALIVQCASADDVSAAVRFAADHGLVVAVRGGGHNIAGSAVCDGGLMIDLSPMKAVRVDARRRTASGGARSDARRVRCRSAEGRPRDAARDQLDDRRGRPDAWRWVWLVEPAPGPHHR